MATILWPTEALPGRKRPVGFDGDNLSSNRTTSWNSAFGRVREVDGNYLSGHRDSLWEQASGWVRGVDGNCPLAHRSTSWDETSGRIRRRYLSSNRITSWGLVLGRFREVESTYLKELRRRVRRVAGRARLFLRQLARLQNMAQPTTPKATKNEK